MTRKTSKTAAQGTEHRIATHERRDMLLDAASKLLVREGPDAISVRRLADSVGTSTMAIYTLFGGKDGLLRALFEEGFERLAEAQASIDMTLEPLERLRRGAHAYRKFALENPAYYGLMISVTMPVSTLGIDPDERQPSPPAQQISAHRAYTYLYEATAACFRTGLFRKDVSAREVADSLWAVVHGLVSLELAGYHRDTEVASRQFDVASDAIVRGFLTEAGVERYAALDLKTD